MKNPLMLLAIHVAWTVSMTQAAVLTNTGFNYIGALTTNGWVAYSGADSSITSDGSVASLGAGAEDISLAFADQGTGPVFASFTLNVRSMPSTGAEYSFGLIDGTAMEGRFGLASANLGASFALTIYGSGSSVLATSATLSLNTDYLVAIYGNGSTDQRLWIDPVSMADFNTPALQATAAAAAANIDGIFLRQAGALDAGAASWTVGDLTVATTFAEVVPEPSTYVLLALAAIGLGTHAIRRRHRARN